MGIVEDYMTPMEIAVPTNMVELRRLAYAVKLERDTVWSMLKKLEELGEFNEDEIDLCDVWDDTADRALMEGLTQYAEKMLTDSILPQDWAELVRALGRWQIECALGEAARRIVEKLGPQEESIDEYVENLEAEEKEEQA